VIDALPAESITWVRGWDLASTTDGDWTAGAKLGAAPTAGSSSPTWCVSGKVRMSATLRCKNTAALDGKSVRISLPQDPGQAGKTQILYLTRQLAGYRVISSPESGDKITRAEPFAAQVNVGNVHVAARRMEQVAD
jgi:phage terminase large subunit-like protein